MDGPAPACQAGALFQAINRGMQIMDFQNINGELVTGLLLLLLIGIGPKIALVPFLEKTKDLDAESERQLEEAIAEFQRQRAAGAAAEGKQPVAAGR